MGFVAEEFHSSLRHSALHLSATKKHGSVTQACRAALLGDENARKCHPSVPYFTLGRRKVWVSLPKSPFIPSSLHPFILTSFCLVPFGNENGLKCRLKVLYCTLGRRKSAKVSPKRAALHPRATKMYGSVAQVCRATPSGDEKYGFRCRRVPLILTSFCPTPTGNKNGRKCRLNVSCRTLGRRRSAEVSLKRAVLHSRVTKMLGSVTQACRTLHSGDEKYGFRCRGVPFILTSFCLAPFGNENGLKCRLKVSYCTLGRRKCSEVSPKRAVFYSWATKSMGFVAEESHSSLRHSALHLSATKMG